jgi:uncharacterized protein (TIGR00266 family)
MEITLRHKPAYSLAAVKLDPNEVIRSEPGAMVAYTDGMTTETKAEGGLFGGLKRMVAGESFFQNTWKAPTQGGEILLAPALPGDMVVIEVGATPFMLQSGAYIASESQVAVDASWGGSKGFFGSGSLILLKLSGTGTVLAGAYGAIEERTLAAGERFTIDTGHIVGFEGTMSFQVNKVGSWKSTLLGGEGLVCELTGPGRVLIQTRSEEALVNWIIPKLPTKSN